MKRLLLILMLVLMPLATAYYWDSSLGYYGQNQYYYVVFDGEGEAAVVARLEIQNTDNLTSLEFTIPGENVNVINIVQEYYDYEKSCIDWEELACDSEDVCSQVCSEYSEYKVYPPKYAQVDYITNYYGTGECGEDENCDGNAKELFVTIEEIPEQDQQDIYILVYYKSTDYVKENMGLYKYNFETIMNEYDTNYVRVSLDVAEDMYMNGLSSAIEYRTEMSSKVADVASIGANLAYVDTGYTEEASALDPYESFNVKGKYAENWFRMNWWIVLIGAILVAGAITGGVYGIRKLNKKDKKLGLSLLIGLGTGFGLWVIIGVSAYILMVLNSMYYMNIVGMLVMMITILVALVCLIAPSVLVGLNKGWNNGIYCFITIIITLFVLSMISLIVLLALGLPSSSSFLYF
ncbi:MAG: hypothetical protein J4472_01875 [DPANN group archaeon]|nr:hypothetical protein [DPANN group archaeon]